MAISRDAGSYQDFGYTGQVEEFTIPHSALYKLETWGACGGYYNYWHEPVYDGSGRYPYGGYACGYKLLKSGTKIYIACGGWPGTSHYDTEDWSHLNNGYWIGGFNGGGTCSGSAGWDHRGAGGGGATSIALVTGTIAQIGQANLDKILIIAGGGGGSTGDQAKRDEDLHWGPYFRLAYTGQGGGDSCPDTGWRHHDESIGAINIHGGTQSSGFAFGQGESPTNTELGNNGGGGGGLWGGYSHPDSDAYAWHDDIQPYQEGQEWKFYCNGAGGSGYIGGVPAFSYKGTTYTPSNVVAGHTESAHGKARITYMEPGSTGIWFRNWRTGETEPTEIDALFFRDLRNGNDPWHEITDVYYDGVHLG